MSIFTADKFAAHVSARGADIRRPSSSTVVAAYGDVTVAVLFNGETGRFSEAFSLKDGCARPLLCSTIKSAVDALSLPVLARPQGRPCLAHDQLEWAA